MPPKTQRGYKVKQRKKTKKWLYESKEEDKRIIIRGNKKTKQKIDEIIIMNLKCSGNGYKRQKIKMETNEKKNKNKIKYVKLIGKKLNRIKKKRANRDMYGGQGLSSSWTYCPAPFLLTTTSSFKKQSPPGFNDKCVLQTPPIQAVPELYCVAPPTGQRNFPGFTMVGCQRYSIQGLQPQASTASLTLQSPQPEPLRPPLTVSDPPISSTDLHPFQSSQVLSSIGPCQGRLHSPPGLKRSSCPQALALGLSIWALRLQWQHSSGGSG